MSRRPAFSQDSLPQGNGRSGQYDASALDAIAGEFDLSLTSVMDLLPDAVCVVDPEGRYVYVNPGCERLFGYGRGELIGRNMIELVHPDDRERTLRAAANVMCGNPHLHFENRYVRKDGEVIHIMWSARWSESHRVRVAVARDVTELRRAERVQRAMYRITEAAHVATDLSQLCGQIHGVIDDLIGAPGFFVALLDERQDQVSYPYYADARAPAPQPHRLSPETPLGEVIRSGKPVLANHGDGDDADDCGSTRWLGVPLIFGGAVRGAVVVRRRHDAPRYGDDDKSQLLYICERIAAVVERRQSEDRLLHMASHDALTGLPNRILFSDRLDTAVKHARRYGERFALLFLDLDGFKEVNDNFGHEVGDRLLQEMALRMSKNVRESDTVGRIGGDEFTVLLNRVRGPRDADRVAEKILAAITAPFELDGRTLTISASIGCAIYPEDGRDGDELLRHADGSMYAAKRGDDREPRGGPS